MTRSLVVLLLAAGVALADVESGPKAGEKAAALKAFAVVGPVEGKEVDFTAERKDAPTVYLFVNAEKFDRPLARFMRELDMKLGDIDEKAAAVAVWVGGDAEKLKDHLPRVQMSLKLGKTSYAVSGEAGGPAGWVVNLDAHLTAVVVVGGKVVKSSGFVSVNETDVKGVVEALQKAAKK